MMALSRFPATSWRGFTMIELLVVLGIAGILLTLVGPFTVNQLANVQRAQEREEIHMLLHDLQFQAFRERRALQLDFAGSTLIVYELPTWQRGPELARYQFSRSEFSQQVLELNRHGFAVPAQVVLRQGEREFTLRLQNLGDKADGENSGEGNGDDA